MKLSARHWVFLGDSLTEGVGKARDTYAKHFAELVRKEIPALRVAYVRMHFLPQGFDGFVDYNFVGYFDHAESVARNGLTIWNLAREATTADDDKKLGPLIDALAPELVFVMRGGLESIVRPACVFDEEWPWWIPRAWRRASAMDPRCYFSFVWWRRWKQQLIDALRQRVRFHLLSSKPGRPTHDSSRVGLSVGAMVTGLQTKGTDVVIIGLPTVDEKCFPGSGRQFAEVNARLKLVADGAGAGWFDLAGQFSREHWRSLQYRDGFHPNQNGNKEIAKALWAFTKERKPDLGAS